MHCIWLLSLILVSCGVSLHAQGWQHDARPWYGTSNTTTRYGFSTALAVDSCTGDVWVTAGDRIWRSTDLGASWEHISVPDLQDFRGRSLLVVHSCNVLYHWEDKAANFASRAMVYERETNTWREIIPPRGPLPIDNLTFGILDSMIVIVPGAVQSRVWVSADLGLTWDSLAVDQQSPGNYIDKAFIPRPGIMAIKLHSGMYELNPTTLEVTQAKVPDSTVSYAYANTTHIVATHEKINSWHLSLSTDAGESWTEYDSIVLVNTGRVLKQSMKQFENFTMKRQEHLISVFFYSGDVISTTDGGLTWYDRGSVGTIPHTLAGFCLTMNHEGAATIVSGRAAYAIPADTSTVRILYERGPDALTVHNISDSTYLASGSYNSAGAFYRTTNAGGTWMQPKAPSELLDHSPHHVLGTHSVYIDRLDAADDHVTVTAPEMSTIFQLDHADTTTRYVRSASMYRQFFTFSHSDVQHVLQGTRFADLRGDTLFAFDTSVRMSSTDTFTIDPIGTGEVRASAVAIGDDSEWLAVSDSVYRSSDRGATWTSLGSFGLPRDSTGRIYETSTIIRLSSNSLILGLRGYYTNADTGAVEQRPGGLYRSDDGGATWTTSGTGLGNQSYIASLVSIDGNVLLCASAHVLEDAPELSYSQTGAMLMRSTDEGRSWMQVYDEPRGHPATWARREILPLSENQILYASIEDGVLESTDVGLSWHPIGSTPLNFRFINDIDVDVNGKIYAATEKGLYSYDPTLTSVDDGTWHLYDPQRSTVPSALENRLSSFPSPARDEFNIPIASQQHAEARLTVVNAMGVIVYQANVSTTLAHIHTVDVGSWPPGVYGLLLDGATSHQSCNVVVQR